MHAVNLDARKLLGFRLVQGATGAKLGVKTSPLSLSSGAKIGGKVGGKPA